MQSLHVKVSPATLSSFVQSGSLEPVCLDVVLWWTDVFTVDMSVLTKWHDEDRLSQKSGQCWRLDGLTTNFLFQLFYLQFWSYSRKCQFIIQTTKRAEINDTCSPQLQYTIWINVSTIHAAAAPRWQLGFSHSAVVNYRSKRFHIDPKGSHFHCYHTGDSLACLWMHNIQTRKNKNVITHSHSYIGFLWPSCSKCHWDWAFGMYK